jgi:hypothetical protein
MNPVIPAEAGIQRTREARQKAPLDPRLRGDDVNNKD